MDHAIATPSLQDQQLSLLSDYMASYMPQGKSAKPVTFEVAWEVANQVGPIYTVLRSKALATVRELSGRYFLVGPMSAGAANEVSALDEDELSPPIRAARDDLRAKGVAMTIGRWLVEGNPFVVLLDVAGVSKDQAEEWETALCDQLKIEVPDDDSGCRDAISFGMAAALLASSFRAHSPNTPVLVHAHEWLAAVAVLGLPSKGQGAMHTIYTTHGPLLGRYICSDGKRSASYHSSLAAMDAVKEADKMGIGHRFAIEKAAAQRSTVLSAISHVCADEAKALFGRPVDVVLPNGLMVKKFEALHTLQNLHAEAKARIHDFVMGHFHGACDFNTDNCLYMFAAGRYEFENKGIDVLLEALGRLNTELKQQPDSKTVVMFLLFPKAHTAHHPESLKSQGMANYAKDAAKVLEERIAERLLNSAYAGKIPDFESLLDDSDHMLIQRCVQMAQRDHNPPVVTHLVTDSDTDPILAKLAELGLDNGVGDKVKVVFHPQFLTKANPLFGIDYEDFVRGCHLGVFPSLYEPWGYTPAESVVLGIPVVASNLSGFGRFVQESVPDADAREKMGMYLLDRANTGRDDVVSQLAAHMLAFCGLSRRERITQRNHTEQRLGRLLDWGHVASCYTHARDLALKQ